MKLQHYHYFDVAEALYWYCRDFHDGEYSREYQILSTLHFKPSPMANGPDSEDSQRIYDCLLDRKFDVDEALNFVQESLDSEE